MNQINTLHLFPILTEELLSLLKSLNKSDWLKSSPIEGRTVKDLVAHIIDGSLRKLSIQRDGFSDITNIPKIQSYSDLVNHIQTLNREWMNITRRLSSEILIDLLKYSENEFNRFINTLDPDGIAIYPVNWAGESESKNWFDTAREYTEVWHHQMQIRLALGKPILMETKFTEPLYDTFMRGLPHFYKDIKEVEIGYKLQVKLTGQLNKSWVIEKTQNEWKFVDIEDSFANTTVELPDDVAWKIFTNTDREKAKYKAVIKINGDEEIGSKILEFVTVMS